MRKQYLNVRKEYNKIKTTMNRDDRKELRTMIDSNFYATYFIESNLATESDYGVSTKSCKISSELYQAMQNIEGGKYNTQLGVLELGM